MLSFYAKMYIFLLIDVVFFNFCTPIVLIGVHKKQHRITPIEPFWRI